jgi:hypothetical protein
MDNGDATCKTADRSVGSDRHVPSTTGYDSILALQLSYSDTAALQNLVYTVLHSERAHKANEKHVRHASTQEWARRDREQSQPWKGVLNQPITADPNECTQYHAAQKRGSDGGCTPHTYHVRSEALRADSGGSQTA